MLLLKPLEELLTVVLVVALFMELLPKLIAELLVLLPKLELPVELQGSCCSSSWGCWLW